MKMSLVAALPAAFACYAAPAQAQEVDWGGVAVFAEGGPTTLTRTNDPAGYPPEQEAEGYFAGGGLQYNLQAECIVIGVEVAGHGIDAESRSLIDSCASASCGTLYEYHRSVKGEWDASIAFHVGGAFGPRGEIHPYAFYGYKAVGIAERFEYDYPTHPNWDSDDTKRSVGAGETYGFGVDWSPWSGIFIGLRYENAGELEFSSYASGFSERIGDETYLFRAGFKNF